MASSYSSKMRFELPGTGEQSGTWGTILNTFMGSLLEDAIAGNLSKAMPDADYTLTTNSGSTDEARNQGMTLTGALTAPRNLIVPTVARHFQVFNSTNQTVTVKTAAGAGAALAVGTLARLWCDGTSVYFATLPVVPSTGNPLSLTVPTASFTTLGVSGATTLASLSVSAASALTSLGVSGVTALGTTPTASTPLILTSSTAALAMEIKGRVADGIGVLRFMDNAGSTELARLQSGAGVGTLALKLGSTGAITAFSTTAAGAIVFPGAVTCQSTFNVNSGRSLVVGTSNPSINVYDTAQSYCGGMYLGGSQTLGFGSMDGLGNLSGTLGYFTSAGNFVASGSVTAFSDARLKTAIVPLDADEAGRIVAGLAQSAARFDWIDPAKPGRHLGVIAQIVQAHAPEAVVIGPDGTLSVSDRPMVAALLTTVAGLLQRVSALEAAHAAR